MDLDHGGQTLTIPPLDDTRLVIAGKPRALGQLERWFLVHHEPVLLFSGPMILPGIGSWLCRWIAADLSDEAEPRSEAELRTCTESVEKSLGRGRS
jgi:hypothetical protein